MRRIFSSATSGALVALVVLLASAYALRLVGWEASAALVLGALLSSALCLLVSLRQACAAWALPGFIALGAAVVAFLAWRGLANWWWPLGLVAPGVAYLSLAESLPGRLADTWREALRMAAPIVAGVGAVWELGQIIVAAILTNQGSPLSAEDDAALQTSFLISCAILVAGALFWALVRRHLATLALVALLSAQLALALVVPNVLLSDPGANALLALTLGVIALVFHASTYFLRLTRPELVPGNGPPFWRLLTWRRGFHVSAPALRKRQRQQAWWLCLLLDLGALIFILLAAAPVGDLPATGNPLNDVLLIVLSSGLLLSIAVGYWQATPWLLLLAGVYLAVLLFGLGLVAEQPYTFWPLAYLLATALLLGLALWLARAAGRPWGRATFVVAFGLAALAVVFAFESHRVGWTVGIITGLVLSLLGALGAWRMGKVFFR